MVTDSSHEETFDLSTWIFHFVFKINSCLSNSCFLRLINIGVPSNIDKQMKNRAIR